MLDWNRINLIEVEYHPAGKADCDYEKRRSAIVKAN